MGTVTPNSDAHPLNVGKINVGIITARSVAGNIDANTLVVASTSVLSSDATINSVTVGKGANSVATNTVLGLNALDAAVTGTHNVAVGNEALGANTSGGYNAAVGSLALDANTTAANITAIGYGALSGNTTGANNLSLIHI